MDNDDHHLIIGIDWKFVGRDYLAFFPEHYAFERLAPDALPILPSRKSAKKTLPPPSLYRTLGTAITRASGVMACALQYLPIMMKKGNRSRNLSI